MRSLPYTIFSNELTEYWLDTSSKQRNGTRLAKVTPNNGNVFPYLFTLIQDHRRSLTLDTGEVKALI